MNTNHRDIPWLDRTFFENQEKIPSEMLEPYRGQHIAWSWDGTRILASGTDREAVWAKLEAAGIDSGRVVFDYVDDI